MARVVVRKIRPPLKYPGGKNYLARRIVGLMPEHRVYVEPFLGGGAVLLARDPAGSAEVVCDRNRELTNFWRVLQGEASFRVFLRVVQAVPFSQIEWRDAGDEDCLKGRDDVSRAVRFFVRVRQSLAGRGETFAPVSTSRLRRDMCEQASAWLSTVEGLPEVHRRLSRVVIVEGDGVDVVRKYGGPGVLQYLDPPYLPSVRSSHGEYGDMEMTEEDHERLLSVITSAIGGMFMLSGYDSALYKKHLKGWKAHRFNMPNHAAGGREKKRMTEVVWCNF